MNIHPIIVHFPVALLMLYSIAEFLRFKFLRERLWWFYLKAAFVIFGFIGAGFALLTGEIAEKHYRDNPAMRHIIGTHSNWAKISFIIYAVAALAYFVVFLKQEGVLDFLSIKLRSNKMLMILNSFLFSSALLINGMMEGWTIIFLALAGLIALTITGALGGSIVYGSSADPIIRIVYGLLRP